MPGLSGTSDPREGQKYRVQEIRVRSDRWGGGRETVKNQPARKWKESEMHLPVKNQKLMHAYKRSHFLL